jgi:hypothetical protein
LLAEALGEAGFDDEGRLGVRLADLVAAMVVLLGLAEVAIRAAVDLAVHGRSGSSGSSRIVAIMIGACSGCSSGNGRSRIRRIRRISSNCRADLATTKTTTMMMLLMMMILHGKLSSFSETLREREREREREKERKSSIRREGGC